MKQLELLKKMLKAPGIYSTEEQRARARAELFVKQKRRDRKEMKDKQLKLFK